MNKEIRNYLTSIILLLKGQPQMMIGQQAKETYIEAIRKLLLK